MLTPAFVIHSRPYRETSQLVEVFTQDSGRFTLVARGSRGPRSPLKGLLQPFTLLTIAWRGKGDLKNLTQVECPDHSLRLGGDRLFGLYLNELVYYLLEAHTLSRKCLTLMPAPSWRWPMATPELPLRRFEFLLLQALGYAVDFEYAADDESPIQPELLYGFERELGFVACGRGSPYPVSRRAPAGLCRGALRQSAPAAGGQAFQPAGAAALSGAAPVEEPGAVLKRRSSLG